MFRKLVLGLFLLAGIGLIIGCDETKKATEQAKGAGDLAKQVGEKAKEAGEKAKVEIDAKAKETAEKAKEVAEKAMKEGKETVLKPITDSLPKLEEKIKSLSGPKLTEATAKFDAFKKLIEDFKKSDASSWDGIKDKLTKAFDELKKLVGM
jgi:hypothetical protein